MGTQEMRADAQSRAKITLAGESADACRPVVNPRTFIVPRRPAALREYQQRSRRRRDELDDLIDALFGPPTDEKPGRFDAGLACVGLGLIAWTAILDGPSAALWIGIAAFVLALALPVHAVLRRFDSSSAGGPPRQGLSLDASHPAALALIDAYARLLLVSATHGAKDPKQAVSAGHAIVVEVARRLEGRPPETPAEVQFVSMQTAALEALSHQMLRPDDGRLAQSAVRTPARVPPPPPALRPISMDRRWMPPPAQAASRDPRYPTTGSRRRS